MPTVLSHAVVGLAAGKTFFFSKQPKRFWLLSILLPMFPDIDVITFMMGIPYAHFMGHRGFFHSIFFAGIVSLIVVMLFFRNCKIFSLNWFKYLVYFFLIASSHSLLDAFTSGGLGIALFAPFDNTRYFFPVTPIQVSPIGIKAFFSEWGLRVIISEIKWIWLPSAGVFIIVFIIKIFIKKVLKNRISSQSR